jgi:hypothetical protein
MGNSGASDFTVDRSVTATAGAGILIGHNTTAVIERVTSQNQWQGFYLGAATWSFCNRCIAQNNYSDGFFLTDRTPAITMQWQMDNCLSQLNNGYGVNIFLNSTDGNETGPHFRGLNTYANTSGGLNIGGNGSSNINDLIIEGSIFAGDGNLGIHIANPGSSIVIANVFQELAGVVPTGRGLSTAASKVGHGLLLDSGGNSQRGSVQVANSTFSQNSQTGITLASSSVLPRLELTGNTVWGNGWHGSGALAAGIFLQSSATNTSIFGGAAFDGGARRQSYGLYMTTSAVQSRTIAAGVNFNGNVSGGCNTVISGGKAAVLGSGC